MHRRLRYVALTALLGAIILTYVLSYGPAMWFWYRFELSTRTKDVLVILYEPLAWIRARSATAESAMGAYVRFWIPSQSTWLNSEALRSLKEPPAVQKPDSSQTRWNPGEITFD